MKKFIKVIKSMFSLIAGYFLIPSSYLGFILATNSSKGWNVQNNDGLLFIPVGILILILTLLIFSAHIFCFLFSTIKNRKLSFDGLYLLGIIFYLITWLLL